MDNFKITLRSYKKIGVATPIQNLDLKFKNDFWKFLYKFLTETQIECTIYLKNLDITLTHPKDIYAIVERVPETLQTLTKDKNGSSVLWFNASGLDIKLNVARSDDSVQLCYEKGPNYSEVYNVILKDNAYELISLYNFIYQWSFATRDICYKMLGEYPIIYKEYDRIIKSLKDSESKALLITPRIKPALCII